jgi:hypothetical protein
MTPSEEFPDRRQVFSDLLLVEFRDAGFALIDEETWTTAQQKLAYSAADLLSGPGALSLGRKLSADFVVSGFFAMDEDRIMLSLSCYDVANGMVAGFARDFRYNLGFYNAIHSMVGALLPRITSPAPASAENASTEAPAAGKPVSLSAIRFTSPQNGMEVLIAGDVSAGRIDNGTLSFQVGGIASGAPLRVEKRLEGYHGAQENIHAAPDVALAPLAKKTYLAGETSWTLGQLLGVGGAFRLYMVPDSLFASLGFYPYAQLPIAAGGVLAMHYDTSLRVGLYLLFPPDWLFRMGISMGGGVITTSIGAPGFPLYQDFYLNVIGTWVELNLAWIAIFLQMDFDYTMGLGDNNLLGRRMISVDLCPPPITIGALFKW